MKHTKITIAIIALGLIALNSCKKESITSTTLNNENVATQTTLADGEGVVYTMDNAVSGNNIIVFKRATNGALSGSAIFSTGGTGTGAGLGSQGAIAMDSNAHLFVCNAGSNDITVFKMNGLKLTKTDRISSHGIKPISLTVHDNKLYVLNAGGTGNISGYTIDNNGLLTHIAKSNRALSSDHSDPAQIEFNPAGTQLVVTEKATNLIVTYSVDANGVAGQPVKHPSTGETPFGFEFAKNNQLIVSDAFGGAVNESALSSYKLNNNGNLSLVTGPVATHQTAACWVVVTGDKRFCYTTNTGSNSISGYKINDIGALRLIDANGITAITDAVPTDMTLSSGSKYLYALTTGSGSISAYKVNNNGGLTSIGYVKGVSMSAAGLIGK